MSQFDLTVDMKQFHQWYLNWRTEKMNVIPDDTSFDIWMDFQVLGSEEKFSSQLVGTTVWYAVEQECPEDLTTDIYLSGVFIKQGIVLAETEETFTIEGYSKVIRKTQLSNTVFFDRNHLLYSLHYDGAEIYDGPKFRESFETDTFIIFD